MGLIASKAVKQLKSDSAYIGQILGNVHLGQISERDAAELLASEYQRDRLREAFAAAKAEVGEKKALRIAKRQANVGADAYARLGSPGFAHVLKDAEATVVDILSTGAPSAPSAVLQQSPAQAPVVTKRVASAPEGEDLKPSSTMGQRQETLESCVRGLETAQRLASSDPDRVDYQRKLADAYNQLGDAQRALGMRDDALESYTRRLQVAQRLAAAEPDRVDYQRKLAGAYDELGDAQRVLGKQGEALESYTRSLQIVQRLVSAEPDRVDFQRRLAIAHSRLGHVTADVGDDAAAEAHFSADVRIARRIVALQPESANATVNLAESLRRLASVHGDPRPHRAEAVAILEQLGAQGRLNKRGASVLAQTR